MYEAQEGGIANEVLTPIKVGITIAAIVGVLAAYKVGSDYLSDLRRTIDNASSISYTAQMGDQVYNFFLTENVPGNVISRRILREMYRDNFLGRHGDPDDIKAGQEYDLLDIDGNGLVARQTPRLSPSVANTQ